MATVGAQYKTLVDLATDGALPTLVEILTRKNPLMADISQIECNDGSGHKTRIRTGYPEPTWRAMYQGVQPTKGTTAGVRDTCGNLEDYGEVDKLEYELAGDNRDTWRMEEDFAHIEGMGNAWESTLWYGNVTTSPEKFHGITPRYNALSGSNTAENIIDCGGSSTDNTSMWLLGLGPQTLTGIYPKGTKAGLDSRDLGEQTRQNSDGSRYQMLLAHYKQTGGISLRDWRCSGRMANVDVSDIRTNTTSMKALINYMIQLSERVEDPPGGKKIWYANKTIITGLRIGILEKIANNLTWETVEGKKVMVFDEHEIHRADGLLNNETRVT
jgi:hypothetical protein